MQPPQNPYSGSGYPGPNDPIPPGGYGGSNSPTGIPNGGPTISFDVIGQAWKVLSSNWGAYIGAFVVVILVGTIFRVMQSAVSPTGFNGRPEVTPVSGLVGLVGSCVQQIFSAGMLRLAINNLRTGRAQFGDLFSAFEVAPNICLAFILILIASVIGFCACIIPGLVLTGLFMFVNPLIVDRRLGAIDAISTSFNTLKSQWLMATLFIIVLILVALAGVLACLVGVLITAPLAVISVAITYRNFFDNGSTPGFGGQSFPVAPIADPRF